MEIANKFMKYLFKSNFDAETAKSKAILESMINKLQKHQEEENELAEKENRKPEKVFSNHFVDYKNWVEKNSFDLSFKSLSDWILEQKTSDELVIYKNALAFYELEQLLKEN
ncbi:Putative uncharacterized protein MCJ_003550 (plasmid) [Mesomycoplasma conjunctivae]|uniref:Uncharacterized protein n=1 Tax=Mesomycoplasma conjunctivae (strain ATCC 25834 / NCTC 10147 / HRC/581) TaxID=572263 RepID=C5J6F2_MESCH|nr:hypothetical protein [Mesomycoplasma conjunctivae]CAT05044.1 HYPOTHETICAL PROTEIN MCJ_003550 [Mesomycoplasma conjunctivae]VEU66298.1 Putative uncharacterized protein MCJ_003550 [Mesomycoplasma conjunctivae]VEU66805.1 Putative uncharacterized protein MCJ_003550 [Mesomycoplasma conjunctivae]